MTDDKQPCEKCQGRGLLPVGGPEAYCPVCKGLGVVPREAEPDD